MVTLLLLLAVNAGFNPGFWRLQWRDGHLYGSLIDILNRASPLILVALGMTLVIATGGLADYVLAETHIVDVHDPTLTLKGLRLYYERNVTCPKP